MGDCAQCDRDNRGDRATRAREPGAVAGVAGLHARSVGEDAGARTKIKFFATATAASTLVADGKDIKETTKQLAANEKTEIKAGLTRKFHNQVEQGDRVKIKGTATDQSGASATDTVKAKVTDCPGRGQKADCTGR